MAYWLVKSEPETWSWAQHREKGVQSWDGVRNHQAANNMKTMKKGDRAFFYHSGKDKEIVGVLEVVGEYRPDPTDETGRFGMVDFRALETLPRPVTLPEIKTASGLASMAFLRQPRLSVSPVTAAEWATVCAMGGWKRKYNKELTPFPSSFIKLVS